MITEQKWRQLRKFYPWPVDKPQGKKNFHGWLAEDNKTELAKILSELESPLVVEIGTWLGLSTRFFLKESKGKLITIDHFKGSKEHHENIEWKAILDSGLEQQARINLVNFQSRCLIVKGISSQVLPELFRLQLQPDVIYIDGSHEFDAAYTDIAQAVSFFDNAVICGDDGNMPGVQKALSAILDENENYRLEMKGRFWRIHNV